MARYTVSYDDLTPDDIRGVDTVVLDHEAGHYRFEDTEGKLLAFARADRVIRILRTNEY